VGFVGGWARMEERRVRCESKEVEVVWTMELKKASQSR